MISGVSNVYLVQYHSGAGVGKSRSLKYWTTADEANLFSTIEECKNKLALLDSCGGRDYVSVSRITKGQKVKHAGCFSSKVMQELQQYPKYVGLHRG